MRLFKDGFNPGSFAEDVSSKFNGKIIIHTLSKAAKLAAIVVLAGFFLVIYILPFAQNSLHIHIPDQVGKFFPITRSGPDAGVSEVLNLAKMIGQITDNRFGDNKVLKYAGLIYQSSKQCGVNPLEIIAIIMAESGFEEKSINRASGDYGLGQINWVHWGREYGYTPQELLDPSVNIFLTCYVYKYFGQNVGKYNRGNGVQCKAYVANVQGILTTLKAYSEMDKENPSHKQISDKAVFLR
jgi:hypothetical protein